MKNIQIWIPCFVLFSCCFVMQADESMPDDLRISLSAEWGKPAYSQYTAINKTSEWRYDRKYATLIVSKAECAHCKPPSQQDVDALNKSGDPATKAILVNHRGVPAMLRLHASPKGVNLRTFQMDAGGFRYEFQLGIDGSAPQEVSFMLEMEFLEVISRFEP